MGISKEEFRHIEGLLYRYFEQPHQINSLNRHIELLQKQVQELEERIKHNCVSVETELNMGIDYSRDKIQTSSQGSYVETEMCRQVQKLEDRKGRKKQEIEDLLNKIQDVNENNQIIHDNLVSLSEENKDFIRFKYQQKVPYPQIFDDTHLSKSAWFDKRNKLIEKIADWFRFVGKG